MDYKINLYFRNVKMGKSGIIESQNYIISSMSGIVLNNVGL